MRKPQSGFSLIEVVLAVALLGLTIVAVVGLVGAVSRSVTDIDDLTIASRLSDTLQEELRRAAMTGADYNALVANTPIEGGGGLPLELFANAAGDRVILATDTARLDHPEEGIPQRDRYYQIHVTRLGGDLDHQNHSPFVALRVRVRWPHNLPTGPGPNDFVPYVENTDDEARQRIAIYHVAVPRTH